MLIDEIYSLPTSPGVYQYFDEFGKLLYVGKAKILKNRVRSYFSFTPSLSPNPRLGSRIKKMISEVKHLKFIITKNESDALILENSLIKSLKPKYNILLRDDKTYPYIYIDLNDLLPRPKITRKIIKKNNIRYFGPYSSGGKEILNALFLIYQLVQKNGCAREKKACIYYQMKRCFAPCIDKISTDEYKEIVNLSINALKNPKIMIPKLTELMFKYAEVENFEEAKNLRDTIEIIKKNTTSNIELTTLEDFEVIGVKIYKNLISYTHFSIRDGKIINSINKINDCKFQDESEDLSEIYKQVILDFFSLDKPIVSSKIYVANEFEDQDILQNYLSEIHNKKFQIITPIKGIKHKLCEIAKENALLFIQKSLKEFDFDFLENFKKFFELENLPINIESFDNSQLFGQAKVGAFISYNLDGFNKSNYRHIHLKDNNDYDQMRELLIKRVEKFSEISPPDLWVIDGGKTLLNLALEIVNSTGVNIDVIAISKEKSFGRTIRAKGGASDIIYSKNGEFRLSQNDKKLQFIQKLRDEAHRFVINFHRLVKKNEDLKSSELQNLGISQAMIKKLLLYFGNFEAIYNANFEELKKVSNKNTAEKIIDFMQKKI